MARSSSKGTMEVLEADILSQENVSRRGKPDRNSKQHVRHRASIACFSCRDRRIRCVVPKGGSGCVQCRRSGTDCVIKMDDERRRPISKAYVSSLSSRITLLESILQDNGVTVPPVTHPPMTKHDTQNVGSGDELQILTTESRPRSKSDPNTAVKHVLSPPYTAEDLTICDAIKDDPIRADMLRSGKQAFRKEQSTSETPSCERDNAKRFLFGNGGLLCDRSSVNFRFFGPTANYHVYSEPICKYDSKELPEQVRRAERIIRSITPQTHEYIMQSFWKYHNNAFQVVDRHAFEADRGSENPSYYSSFLHIILLAIGWRFANKDRYDIAKMSLGNHESILHREAKNMLSAELERPMGITTVQSLLLLGDLECGSGRDQIGWIYTGMAHRLAFDIGLHLECRNVERPERPEQEANVRKRVMRACFLYDRYWALFLGRPTSYDSQDIGIDIYNATTHIPHSSERDSGGPEAGGTQAVEDEIHEQLIELMDLASQVVEYCGADQRSDTLLLRQQRLQEWYGRLPTHLTWRPDNIKTAPCHYFLLHEQYHAVTILLHRSWEAYTNASHDDPASEDHLDPEETPRHVTERPEKTKSHCTNQGLESRDLASLVPICCTKAAQSECAHAAVQISQIISQFKERYDLEKTCLMYLQPATTAAVALLGAMASPDVKDDAVQQLYQSSFEGVKDALQGMGRSYEPAIRTGNLIQAILSRVLPNARLSRLERRSVFRQDANGYDGAAQPQSKEPVSFSTSQMHHHHSKKGNLTQNPEGPPAYPNLGAIETTEPLHSFNTLAVSYNQTHPQHQHPDYTSSIYPAIPNTPNTYLYQASLYNNVMEVESPNVGGCHSSDHYLRVAPSATAWGLHSLHAASQQLGQQPGTSIDFHMPDWIRGTGNIYDNTTAFNLTQSSHSDGVLGNCKREDTSGSVWRGFGTLTPISPEHDCHDENNDTIITTPPRNHELDFLSL